MNELQRESWRDVVDALDLANQRFVPKETAQWLMDEHFAAEEALLRRLHPELMSPELR